MKLLSLLALVLMMAIGCSSPEEKKAQQEAKAEEQYEQEMEQAEIDYTEDKKEEAKDVIDEGSDVSVGKKKQSIEVEE